MGCAVLCNHSTEIWHRKSWQSFQMDWWWVMWGPQWGAHLDKEKDSLKKRPFSPRLAKFYKCSCYTSGKHNIVRIHQSHLWVNFTNRRFILPEAARCSSAPSETYLRAITHLMCNKSIKRLQKCKMFGCKTFRSELFTSVATQIQSTNTRKVICEKRFLKDTMKKLNSTSRRAGFGYTASNKADIESFSSSQWCQNDIIIKISHGGRASTALYGLHCIL